MNRFGRSLYAFCAVALVASGPALTSAAESAETATPENIPGVIRVDAEGVLRLVDKHPRLIIVDSRIAMDRHQGYIEGSVSLPDVDTSCQSLARVIPAKSHPALFYCNGPKCGRSAVAVRIARQCGYQQIFWYRGGFEDWKQNGYPYLKL